MEAPEPQQPLSAPGVGKDFEPSTSESTPCRQFEFPEILIATENFDESLVIGRGGFGKVYKGKVICGASLVVAAIKRLDPKSTQGVAEFWSEVEILSMLRHNNIVSLIGYCSHEKEKILIYEYMPNGTLDDHLHKFRTRLSWVMRLKICIDAGRGLRFLHNEIGSDSGIIHRDVKSPNILLHESWTAKVADFGLSKTCPTNRRTTYVKTRVKGSFGYFDPKYFQTGVLTRKSDVYAFGVVLLEVLCRKRAVDKTLDEDQWSLVQWVKESIKEGKLKHIVDSDIRFEISPKCLKEFVKLADKCFQDDPKERPTMVEVVDNLENVLNLQERFMMQPAGSRTIFGKMVDMLLCSSNRDNYAHGGSKLSSNNNGRIASNTVRADDSMFPKMKEVPAHFQSPNPSLKDFRFDDLEKATKSFSPDLLLSKGIFKKVFLGWVEQSTLAPSKQGVGIAIAVRRFRQGYSHEWLTEVIFLGNLAHPNIIRLLGYCKDEEEHLLVYEYMSYKALDDLLFTYNAKRLTWGKRFLIMIGIARGLTYLHSVNVIHRDLSASNIFLDGNFKAKLGGFGLARYADRRVRNLYHNNVLETYVTEYCREDFGYSAPEYMQTGRFTTKVDIYAFGVVLLESMTGQRAVDYSRSELKLVDWALPSLSNSQNLTEIMDPRLEYNYPIQGALECAALVLRCVAKKSKNRPSSKEVLQNLEQIFALHR